jgi:hypothetical protein
MARETQTDVLTPEQIARSTDGCIRFEAIDWRANILKASASSPPLPPERPRRKAELTIHVFYDTIHSGG